MKSTGIVRKLDVLGRITIPMELRRTLDIGDRCPLEMYTDGDKIILKKYNPSDIFTGKNDPNMITYNGKSVSHDSIRELIRIAGLEIKE